MAPRLLFLLSLVENALIQAGSSAADVPGQRTISFHKGLARLVFAGGTGSILLQNFVLADGQICIKATIGWADRSETGFHALYPKEDYNWREAAQKIAQIWASGPVGSETASTPAADYAANGIEPLVAVATG